MNAFSAYKYYQALKLHFQTDAFDVFVNKNHIRGSYAKFEKRNDRYLFEKLASKYTDREYVKYVASNMMYGNFDVIYNGEGEANYRLYEKRKQAITKLFLDDIRTIHESDNGCIYDENILRLLVGDKIMMETAVIINNHRPFTTSLMEESSYGMVFEDTIRRVAKGSRFVIYSKDKMREVCNKILGDQDNG